MRGNAIGKPEMLLEPLLVVLSPDANCLRPICPGDHCHDRNNQEVTEYMQAINMRPRILQIFKTGKNRINVIELDLGHKRRLSKGNWGRISAPIYHCQKTARAQLALDSLSNPECALAVHRAHYAGATGQRGHQGAISRESPQSAVPPWLHGSPSR